MYNSSEVQEKADTDKFVMVYQNSQSRPGATKSYSSLQYKHTNAKCLPNIPPSEITELLSYSRDPFVL